MEKHDEIMTACHVARVGPARAAFAAPRCFLIIGAQLS